MSVNIQLEWTPNPSTLKYVVDRPLLPQGALNITSRQMATEKSPLAARLFEVNGVAAVMLGKNFVTVTKGEQGEWDELNDQVMAALDEYLSSDKPLLAEGAMTPVAAAPGGDPIESRIKEILETEIRPAVMYDGGDIVFDRFEDGVVYVQMQGSCSGCPSSTATLKMGIESRLREAIPEVNEVVSV